MGGNDIMNIYDDFFKGISYEYWEFFAADFLGAKGYIIESPPARGADNGKDMIVSFKEKRYIVSCKHFIHSNKSVTEKDEASFLERTKQHKANGFIGFYSTLVSQNLLDRLIGCRDDNFDFIIFDKDSISNYLPNISCFILQKYGAPAPNNFYYMNVSPEEYQPLPCISCEIDIISDEMIKLSMAGIAQDDLGKLHYIFGCKYCIQAYCDKYWLDHLQALYIEQLIGWDRCIQEYVENKELDKDFWKNYFIHRAALMQRVYPAHLGVYPTALIEW
jgi:putitive lysogenic conversion protein (hypothetical protein)